MKKKLFITGLTFALTASFTAAVAFANISEGESKPVVYEYALLGDTYETENGLVSAKKPDGTTLSAREKSIFLDWAQGSYIFEYKNKTVNLKVYEAAPEDEITYSGEMPAETVAGVRAFFPAATVKSGIVRTDGAPEIGFYEVSATFSHKGEDVYTVKNAGEEFYFTPAEGGIYELNYIYKDVFGRTRSKSFLTNAREEKIVVYNGKTEFSVGERLSLSSAYGFYKGENYAATGKAVAPSGETKTFNDYLIFSEKGKYQITLSSEIAGETAENTFTAEIGASLSSFVTNKSGFSDSSEFINHENVKNAPEKGLYLDCTAAESSFDYNGVIDLKKLGKTVPVISFTTNNAYGGNISVVEVTLTDVYDAKKAVTVRFTRNSDVTATSLGYDNTLVRASFGSVSTAFNNYYPLKTDAVAWDTTFYGFWRSAAHVNPDKKYSPAQNLYTMNFSFDYETNEIYSYGNFSRIGRPDGNESGVKQWKIAELSSPSLPVAFEGFTTGEVYLSFKVSSGRGDIVIDTLGGINYGSVSARDYATDTDVLIKNFDGGIPAIVGKNYPVPNAESKFISSFTRKVIFGGEETVLTGDYFVPEKEGKYTLVYSGVNPFGVAAEKRVEFECLKSAIPIEITYDEEAARYGEAYEIKTPVISGGHGKVVYKIFANGESVSALEKIIVSGEETEIKIVASDELGNTAEKIFKIATEGDAVLFTVDFPRTAIRGERFVFPQATVKYLATGEILSYEIFVSGVKAEDGFVMPDTNSATVEYRTAKGSKEFVLYLKSAEVKTGGDALIFEGEASTTDEGTRVKVTKNSPVISLPYKLSPNGLYFEFIVLVEKLDFGAVSFKITGENGVSVKLTVADIQKDYANFLVNGEDAAVRIEKRKQTFSSSASEGFAGKDYYAFSVLYEDYYRATLSGSAIQKTIEKDERGVKFTGFNCGVYADIILENVSEGGAEIVITKISNQLFYSSSFDYGDVVGPALFSKNFRLGNANVGKNYELDVSELSAFDVITGKASVTVTLTAPSGVKIYENTATTTAPEIVLTEIGVYLLRITAKDSGNVVTNANCRFSVEDGSAPELIVSEELVKTAKVGDKIKLPAASCTDETAATVRVFVTRPDGKVDIIEGGANSEVTEYEIKRAGTYRITYVAEDEYGNVSVKTFIVTAEEK